MADEVGPRYLDRLPIPVRDAINAVDPAEVYATFVAYVSGTPAGHAALRWNTGLLELKRMYVRSAFRGSDVATALLSRVETAAVDSGAHRLVLQTGDRQPDAVRFYERNGYRRIRPFAPYHQLPFSRCYTKDLDSGVRRWLRLGMAFLSTPTGVRAACAGVA